MHLTVFAIITLCGTPACASGETSPKDTIQSRADTDETSDSFLPGDEVEIIGMNRLPEYNETRGRIINYFEDKLRYCVRLDSCPNCHANELDRNHLDADYEPRCCEDPDVCSRYMALRTKNFRKWSASDASAQETTAKSKRKTLQPDAHEPPQIPQRASDEPESESSPVADASAQATTATGSGKVPTKEEENVEEPKPEKGQQKFVPMVTKKELKTAMKTMTSLWGRMLGQGKPPKPSNI